MGDLDVTRIIKMFNIPRVLQHLKSELPALLLTAALADRHGLVAVGKARPVAVPDHACPSSRTVQYSPVFKASVEGVTVGILLYQFGSENQSEDLLKELICGSVQHNTRV